MSTKTQTSVHKELILSRAKGVEDIAGVDPMIVQSWKRSLDTHNLDPGCASSPRILTSGRVREHREPLELMLDIAKGGVETLFQQIRDAGYVILLADAAGVTVDFKNNPLVDRELRRAGLYLGSCWSEDEEGTCAVGLCVVERQPITVHQVEHFRAPNASLTCSAAPILAPNGDLVAVLDASALVSPGDKRSQHLVLQMVKSTARMIENAYFLHEFESKWVMRINWRREFLDVATEGLVALEEDGTILAANQRATLDIRSDNGSLVGEKFEDVFGTRFQDIAPTPVVPEVEVIALRSLRSGNQFFALPRSPRRVALRHPVSLPGFAVARRQSSNSVIDLVTLAGGDPRMIANVSQALRVVNKGIPVLLHGETGTGKEAFAKAMHRASDRVDAPFVPLNCAAIPESLIESELFGYREGAFTGARTKGVRGKLSQADGGTLFLDEIGDMPLGLQTRLLRVVAEREVMPLGAEKAISVDLQIICATHRNLIDLVAAGHFRQDLYYRLNGAELTIPPLRERADRETLIRDILREQAGELRHDSYAIADDAMALFLHYDWPGNVRQLKHVLRSALALSDKGIVELEHLPGEVRGSVRTALPPTRLAALGFNELPSSGPTSEESERELLLRTLKQKRWNVTLAAMSLGVCRATIYRRMARCGIVPPNEQDC